MKKEEFFKKKIEMIGEGDSEGDSSSGWDTEVSMMKHVPPGLDRHMEENHGIMRSEEQKIRAKEIDDRLRRNSPSKTDDPETVEFAKRKLNALRNQNQELTRWAIYHLRQRRADLSRQIEQAKMSLEVIEHEIREGAVVKKTLSDAERKDLYLKYGRSSLNIRVYNKFAQSDDEHIVSAETLKLVTEAEFRKIKLTTYDAELSRKIDEVLFEKSQNEMIIPERRELERQSMSFVKQREEEEEDFIQFVLNAEPALWSALAATISSTSSSISATEFDLQRIHNQCTTLSVECSEMKERVQQLLNRILRGSINPLLRYALATFLRTSVTTLMAAANSPPGPKRVALIRSLTQNLNAPQNLGSASKLRWEASVKVIRNEIQQEYENKIEEATRESRENREALVKLYRNVSELRQAHEQLNQAKAKRQNLDNTVQRVLSRLESCVRRKRHMQNSLGLNESLLDLRARVRTLWAWRGVYPEYMLNFFRAVRIVNNRDRTVSASMLLRTRREVTRLRIGKIVSQRRRRLLRIVRSIRLLASQPERALSQKNGIKKASDLNRFEPEEVEMHPLNSCENYEPQSLLALLSPLPSWPHDDPATEEGEEIWKAILREKHAAAAVELVNLSNLISEAVEDYKTKYHVPLVYEDTEITKNSMMQCRRVASVPLRFCPMYGAVLSASLSEALFESMTSSMS
jgi:hypothetical protein